MSYKKDRPISREQQLVIDDYERHYWKNIGKAVLKDWRLYVMLLPLLLLFLFWRYLPMYDLTIAFKDANTDGANGNIAKMNYAGLAYFKDLLFGETANYFWPAFRNTFMLSFYGLIFGFPMPILLALFFSEIKSDITRSIFQIASYLPKFVSLVVVTTIIGLLLNRIDTSAVIEGATETDPMSKAMTAGVLARALYSMGIISEETLTNGMLYSPNYFRTIYEVSGIWQDAGYGSIVYFAAIIGISPTNYEAARVDGASKMAQIKYVVLPGILSTIVIMLIMRLGHLMSIGYEKVLLLQTTTGGGNVSTSEVFSTYVFKLGGLSGATGYSVNKSLGSAADMLNAVISMLLVIGANSISKNAADTSMF